jgi:hypothetical protein
MSNKGKAPGSPSTVTIKINNNVPTRMVKSASILLHFCFRQVILMSPIIWKLKVTVYRVLRDMAAGITADSIGDFSKQHLFPPARNRS